MKIYIRRNDGKCFIIPAPIGLVKAAIGLGDFGIVIARKYIPEDQREYYDSIDFKELKKGFDILKSYKGLKILEVNSIDGRELKIVI